MSSAVKLFVGVFGIFIALRIDVFGVISNRLGRNVFILLVKLDVISDVLVLIKGVLDVIIDVICVIIIVFVVIFNVSV